MDGRSKRTYQGALAKEPIRGDWPEPKGQSETEWELIVNDFKKANEKLIEVTTKLMPSIGRVKLETKET